MLIVEEQNENFFEDEPVEYIESIQELSEFFFLLSIDIFRPFP